MDVTVLKEGVKPATAVYAPFGWMKNRFYLVASWLHEQIIIQL